MGLRKDYKDDLEDSPILGPKLRPLCPANIAPNANLGSLIAKTIKILADEVQVKINTKILSTEELKHHIEIVNSNIKNRVANHSESLAQRVRRMNTVPPIQDFSDTITLSMDVTALYSSICKELAVRTIVRTVNKSTIPWEDVNVTQLSRYVALVSDSKSIKDSKLTICIPIPKSRTTLNSFTNPTGNSRVMNGDNQVSSPSKIQVTIK